jgi:hypothetical protein
VRRKAKSRKLEYGGEQYLKPMTDAKRKRGLATYISNLLVKRALKKLGL